VEPPKKESGDSRLGVQNEKGISGRTSGMLVEEPISCEKGVVILLNCGCGVGPPKKDLMEGVDARLGCRNEKGNKEKRGTSRGTFDESFSREEAFKGLVILLGSRE
jgi:hypothetical protein